MDECAAGPCLDHDRLDLVEPRLRLVMVDAEALVIVNVVRAAAAEPDDQPAFEQVIEQRHLFGEPDRMMQRGLDDGEAEPRVTQRGGQRAGQGDRIGIDRDAVEMVLGQPDHVGAQLVGQRRLAQGLLDHRAVLRRIAAIGKQEIAEFHRVLRSGAAPSRTGEAGGVKRPR